MKINVVAVKSGWILTKIAERIVANAPTDVKMVLGPPRPMENNFYVDITNCYRGHHGGKEVGLFTHVHANDQKEIKPLWHTLDHIIHMSERSRDLFYDNHFYKLVSRQQSGATTHSCKMPGEVPPGFEYKKPTIGIFQRGQYEGKGYLMMKRLADSPVARDFNWMFVGGGWEPVVIDLHRKTNVICHSDGDLIWPEEYKNCYNDVDYVLIPSKWEGGPMGLLEAASLGKQIIAARVGWVGRELPVDHTFKPGDDEELAELLKKLIRPRIRARKIVENLSYKSYAQHVVNCFERIK